MGDKIVCLVGESGSGKSTIAELLEKEGYNYIQSYSTRKPRYEGERGHIFVDDASYVYPEIIRQNKHIAYTYFDNAHYWATKEQYQGKGTSIYIIDATGIKKLKERVKDAEIVVIYLRATRITRVARMLKRKGYGLLTPTPSEIYEEISNRATHDDNAFKDIKYDYTVDANNSAYEVLKDIKQIIKGER